MPVSLNKTRAAETRLPAQELLPNLQLRKGEENVGGVLITHMDRVKVEPIQWLWPNYIARGKITLVAGEQGLGKSTGSIDWAARLSRGWPWPDGSLGGKPAGTLFIAAEDGIRDTIKKRLEASQADCSLVKVASGVWRAGDDGLLEMVDLTQDIARLDTIVCAYPKIQNITIDPVTAYFGKGNDPNSEADVRRVLTPLAQWAERRNLAVKIIVHLNKGKATKALHRVSGSTAFTAVARMCLLVAKDKDDKGRRLLIPFKTNLDVDPPALAFRKVGEVIQWEVAPVDTTADEALDERPTRKPAVKAIKAATDFLQRSLSNGPVAASCILADSRALGIGERTLREAKSQLEVRSERRSGAADGGWFWWLPGSESAGKTGTNGHTVRKARPIRVDG